MGKGLACFGLLLIIIGILPIILDIAGYAVYAAYFYLGYLNVPVGPYVFSELMLGLIGLGFILLVIGALK